MEILLQALPRNRRDLAPSRMRKAHITLPAVPMLKKRTWLPAYEQKRQLAALHRRDANRRQALSQSCIDFRPQFTELSLM
jgi:hypothetical protein